MYNVTLFVTCLTVSFVGRIVGLSFHTLAPSGCGQLDPLLSTKRSGGQIGFFVIIFPNHELVPTIDGNGFNGWMIDR